MLELFYAILVKVNSVKQLDLYTKKIFLFYGTIYLE